LTQEIYSLALPPKANILDIGSQNGDFLKGLPMEFQWKLFGVEPSKPTIAALHNPPFITIINGFFSSSDYEKNQFELVNLGDAIEHLEDPEKLVLEVNKICKENGYFIVTTPVIDCPYVYTSNFFHKLFGTLSPQAYLTPPHHLKYFSSTNLDNLLERNNFSKINSWFGPSNFSYELAESEIFDRFREKRTVEKLHPLFLFKVLVFLSMYFTSRTMTLFSIKDFSYSAVYQKQSK
jgi:SAM-dependent methyltransferase